MEIWGSIPSLGNKYEASNLGRVRSNFGRNKGKILKQYKSVFGREGYYFVETHNTGQKKMKKVHRLVAEVFCENPDNHQIVMHLDNNIDNNRSDNLKWGTLKMNSQQMIREGRGNKSKGNKHYMAKLTNEKVLEIRSKYIPRKYTLIQLAKEYNVTFGLIGHIIKNKAWRHI